MSLQEKDRMTKMRVLVVDDEDIIRKEMRAILTDMGYEVYDAALPSRALEVIEKEPIDIALLDVRMPEMNGIELLKKIKALKPDIEVIIITGHGDEDTILEAMRAEAFDFFRKPVRGFDIQCSIERTMRYHLLKNRLKSSEQGLSFLSDELIKYTGTIVGSSSAIEQAIKLTLKAAQSPTAPVLITGPSGSGKELFARVIHYAGSRKDKPFFVINCSAIPENLIESEFFGHTKGAFTGATDDRAGFFERAGGGTLFLDEIGDMPLDLQAKLLRAIENKTYMRIGSTKEMSTDVRIVAATNRDIEDMVAKKLFREDLFYRLNIIEIDLPPLRDRQNDISVLLDHYVGLYAREMNKSDITVDPKVYDALSAYAFPGNVRELKNMCERAVLMCESTMLRPADFPCAAVSQASSADATAPVTGTLSLKAVDDLEKSIILEALRRSDFVKTQAAKMLDIRRQSLDWLIKKHGIVLKTDVAGA